MSAPRVTFQIDDEMREDLKFVPDQLRSEVYRSLLRLLIKTQRSSNKYVIDDLINDRLELNMIKNTKAQFEKIWDEVMGDDSAKTT